MRRLLTTITLLAMFALVGTFGQPNSAAAGSTSMIYCFIINGQVICIRIPVEVDRFEFDDCINCGNKFELIDDRINPAVLKDLQALTTLDVLASQVSPELSEHLHATFQDVAAELALPADVALLPSMHRGAAWDLGYADRGGRQIRLPVPSFASAQEPRPDPWIIDEQLDPAVAQDLHALATMQAVAAQISPEQSEVLQSAIQEAALGLPLPKDASLRFAY